MHIFVDESGTFGWSRQVPSVFASVAIKEQNGALDATLDRLRRWEKTLPTARRRGGEVKGALLTDGELVAFVDSVLADREAVDVSLCGFDPTSSTREEVLAFRDELASTAEPEALRHLRRRDRRTAQTARELRGWLSGRSAEQVTWLICLQSIIARSLQQAVVFAIDDVADEFTGLHFIVDRSWLKNHRHLEFWRAMLNSGLTARSIARPLFLPNHWARTHPFRRLYDYADGLDLRSLWRRTRFAKSHEERGVRVADIVAHIAYRHYANSARHPAFERLTRFIRGEDPDELTVVQPTPR